MIAYGKYGEMTPEFQKYQQETWDKLRKISEVLASQALRDGVCPMAFRESMMRAVECGSVMACAKARVKDSSKGLTEIPDQD